MLFYFPCRCILANDTEKLYVPSNLKADSYETSEFYVRHMHNQECPDQLLRLPSEDKIYFSGTHLCKENDWRIEKYQSGFCVDNFVSNSHGLHVSGFVCQTAPYEILNKTTKVKLK